MIVSNLGRLLHADRSCNPRYPIALDYQQREQHYDSSLNAVRRDANLRQCLYVELRMLGDLAVTVGQSEMANLLRRKGWRELPVSHLWKWQKRPLPPSEYGSGVSRNKHQGLVGCSRTLARTADTQELYANLPGATLWDVQVFLDGWTAGERWASRNADKESEQ
jgi:hypothetical protein